MLKKLNMLLASGLGLGFIPVAPGTWGSLLGIPLAFACNLLAVPLACFLIIVFIGLSIWISTLAERHLNQKDASVIVIDEVVGMAIALLFVPFTVKTVAVAFILFRFFDIVKVFPASVIEKKCPAGYGIVLDDVVAGIYARLALGMGIYFQWL